MTLNVLNHCRSQQAEKEESIILGVIFRRLYQNMQDFFNSLDTLLTSISHEDKIRIFKSENGYLVSLTRIQKRIVDPQRRRILSILSKTGYFGYAFTIIMAVKTSGCPDIQSMIGWPAVANQCNDQSPYN